MSDYFFVIPGFKRGAARVLDLRGGLRDASYLIGESPAEADARALASDWAAVDHDIAIAARKLANEQKEEQRRSR